MDTMAETGLTRVDRIGIAWLLARQGVNETSVRDFVTALESGIALNEEDSKSVLLDFRKKASTIDALVFRQLIEVAAGADRLDSILPEIAEHMDLLRSLVPRGPMGELSSRIVLHSIGKRLDVRG
jgi:hypothetical protein